MSFTLVAQKHIQYLRRWLRVEEVDELAFPHVTPHSRPVVVIHPYFFCMMRAQRFVSRKLHLYGAIIGVDVADSDHISERAVALTDLAHCMVVPSTFAKRAYERSGVRVPVHVVPHGLDPEWYESPPRPGRYFADLLKLKEVRGKKIILFFLWHSGFRKGWDLVIEFYRRLKRERGDVVLVLKTLTPDGPEAREARSEGAVHVYGWLTEEQKMELYDLADLYPLFSRGGGFEHNGLEALARGVPVLAARGGAWEDYLPDWALLPSKRCPRVLEGNPVHDGAGVEVVVEKAVDAAHAILDDLDEYRARVKEHVDRKVKNEFRWDRAAWRLRGIIVEALQAARR